LTDGLQPLPLSFPPRAQQELLAELRSRGVRVALVTRNTTHSVDAFFRCAGEEWRALFSEIRTREFEFVKPDRRLLLDVAAAWGAAPGRLLMVGDSFEDVECGNAAGTASCLVAGGGNEKPGAVVATPAGAVPTFKVSGLPELLTLLTTHTAGGADPATGASGPLRLGHAAGGGTPGGAGAPPPGLDFLDWLADGGSLAFGQCSFPRMGAAAGGLATCEELGTRVAHLCCGAGGLTKLLASQGLQVTGVDAEVGAARKRGLRAARYDGPPLAPGSLATLVARGGGAFDAAIIHQQQGPAAASGAAAAWASEAGLAELARALVPGGALWVESGVPLEAAEAALRRAGYAVARAEAGPAGSSRIVAHTPK